MAAILSTYWNSLTPPRRLVAATCFSFAILGGEAVVGWQIHAMKTELNAISESVNGKDGALSEQNKRLDKIEEVLELRNPALGFNPL